LPNSVGPFSSVGIGVEGEFGGVRLDIVAQARIQRDLVGDAPAILQECPQHLQIIFRFGVTDALGKRLRDTETICLDWRKTGKTDERGRDIGAVQSSKAIVPTSIKLSLKEIDRDVPQVDAGFVKDGYPVTITTTDRPDWSLKSRVTRIAGELDPKTRMMLVEIDVDNGKGDLIPGSYLQVKVAAPDQKGLSIPSEALVVRGGKFFVPVVDSLHQLHYQPVSIGKNDGVFVSIISGVQKGDVIGLNVSPELQENQKVKLQM